ncbi:5'-nucleotidase SurE [Neisseria wadsworthii 9715]|uniref:5'-nucleotidase SurE n=1 Tax=Neisseria wadsworthii 9715 TaxID=1030841 RepID=G4CLY7_9NEIS|nr:5'-nucleotidase SurE [Neisseria wadsworthii 9715]
MATKPSTLNKPPDLNLGGFHCGKQECLSESLSFAETRAACFQADILGIF